MSSLPTAIQRPGGRRAKTVGRPAGSLRVTSSPSGLWYMGTRPAPLRATSTGRPSTATASPGVARSPSCAMRPPSVTVPASIQDSISRREPRPAAASRFWRRSAFGAGGGGGFGFGLGGLGVGRADAGFGGRDGLKLQSLRDFLERRQLLEGAQAEIVEELAGGGVKRRPARRLAMADGVDPAARFQRLDDLRGDGHAADLLDIAAR